MKESKYAPVILETIGDDGASIGTIKKACEEGNSITNIRKSLFTLIKNGIIEVRGYDTSNNLFNYDSIMFHKVNPNYKNPIYVKDLLDNPIKDKNYLKIQEIFKNRIDEINQIYYNELRTLENIMDKMPLKKAIKLGYVESDEIFIKISKNRKQQVIDLTLKDILNQNPETEIWYLKKVFKTELAMQTIFETENLPFFGTKKKLLQYEGNNETNNKNFLDRYKKFFDHLPIDGIHERFLFNYIVLRAFKVKGEERDEGLWNLANDLTEPYHEDFVEELRITDLFELMEYPSKFEI